MAVGISAKQSLVLTFLVGVISFVLNASGFFTPSNAPIIETENGPVQGYIGTSRDGRDYAAYVGIPYAEAPVGELRFEPPRPAKPWKAILEAKTLPPDCYQFDGLVTGRFLGTEDCLFLNVFTPKKPNVASLLPVMFWIHGGGFFSGGSAMYNPKYVMDSDVVLVTVNYRLGPLGFLNNGRSIRGNMGLKDQLLALKWVKQNIKKFGGNPDQVTIFGESAGAASVHAHLLSDASKGLFHKAIMQSGSLASPWSVVTDPIGQANRLAKRVGCPDDDTQEMSKCLKGLSPKDLISPMIDFMVNSSANNKASFLMLPPNKVHLAESVPSKEAFFPEDPRQRMVQRKFHEVPVVMGVTSGEGGLRTSRLEAFNILPADVEKQWNTFCPNMLFFDPSQTEVSQKIRKFYFSDEPFAKDPSGFMKNVTAMISDGWFFHAMHKAASYHATKVPIYLYYYNYDSLIPEMYSLMKAVRTKDWLLAEVSMTLSIIQDLYREYMGYPGPHEYGACHASDLLQFWRMDWKLEIRSWVGDYQFSKNFVKVFTDFARSEEPLKFNGFDWPKIEPNMTKGIFPYLVLDNPGSIADEPFHKKIKFWDSLNLRNY